MFGLFVTETKINKSVACYYTVRVESITIQYNNMSISEFSLSLGSFILTLTISLRWRFESY
jgi:hypothetical protein